MDLLQQRLTHLWMRPTTTTFPPQPEQYVVPNRMGVTFNAPMNISGTTLLPGRYVFRLLDPLTQRNHVEIFNEDRTKLVAELTPVWDV
jgi:hypothetical protein